MSVDSTRPAVSAASITMGAARNNCPRGRFRIGVRSNRDVGREKSSGSAVEARHRAPT